ncbi:GNAT family N-acetyltransferase [Streptomyces flavofungini]|uniref:GNAT family N-acetyltransferase n=1 Tax=Streptomyces flavofungini TaxID=68200 RepID=UPI0025B15F69|nr:GNAT family N-acetyltransferase [Streptomyces flavofungini]WJV47895.1 GNAT family N-acetyltransferase [Streptomyces flavofungini]
MDSARPAAHTATPHSSTPHTATPHSSAPHPTTSQATPHATPLTIRPLPETDIDRALDLAYLVFHDTPEEEKRKHHHDLLLGCDRIGAYDGDTLVGLIAAFRFTVSVPGGELPCPGLTFVSVAPTHRRRGVLSGMIAKLYEMCQEEGRPVAALWASEDAIYGRFGFGPATHGNTVEINSERPLALRVTPDDGPLRLVDPADAPALLGAYYDRTRADRGGRIARSEAWWSEEWLVTEDEEDDELSPPRVVVLGAHPDGTQTDAPQADAPQADAPQTATTPQAAADPTTPRTPALAPTPIKGYALYRTKSRDDARGLVRLDELEADTPQAAAALWRYLADIDLTGVIRAWGRPVDDDLLLFAADRDQVRVTGYFPALWLRLVDVRAALLTRDWAAPAALVLEVTDTQVPANDGRFRLTVSPRGTTHEGADTPHAGTGTPHAGADTPHADTDTPHPATGTETYKATFKTTFKTTYKATFQATYEPTTAPADLSVEVRDLGAAYLGGTRITAAVRAGLATEHTPGAAAALDAALRTDRLPHTVDEF